MVKYKKAILLMMVGFGFGVSVYAASLRLKTYLEISKGLEAATNVNSARPEILSFYLNRKSQLPQKGELTEFTEQSVIVSTSLGSLYCNKMIEKDSKVEPAQRWTHHRVQFNFPPSQGILPDEIFTELLQDYSSLFWQRAVTAEEKQSLLNYAQGLVGDFGDTPDSNRKILLGLCTVFAGSFSSVSF